MSSFDSLLVLGVQLAIAFVFYFINSKWYYSERVKKIMYRTFVVTLILSAISAYGKLQIIRDANLITIVIGNLVYLQIIVQLLSLIIKVIYWTFSKFKEKESNQKNYINLFSNLKKPIKGNDKHLKYSLLSIVLIGTIFLIFNRMNSLTDCELNFVEGSGISKKAYRRIYDAIPEKEWQEWIETGEHSSDIILKFAAASPRNSYNSNIRNTAIRSEVLRECIKDSN